MHVGMRAGGGAGSHRREINVFFIYHTGTERTGLCPEVEENPLHSWCKGENWALDPRNRVKEDSEDSM